MTPTDPTPIRALRTLLLALLLPLTAAASAQDLDSDRVLDNMRVTAETLQDASFLLLGRIVDADGTDIALEIEVQYVPEARAASAYIIQPDALADNIIVLDGDTVANYTYLTNQVTLFSSNDPDALGGLFGADEGESFEFSTDLGQVFSGYEVTVEGYQASPVGDAYLLRFANIDEAANVHHIDAEVVDGAWYPYSLVFFRSDGSVLAELTFEDFASDQGLDPAEVIYLPDDAEIIDERN